MFSKLLLIVAAIAIVASAGTVAAGGHYKLTLFEAAAVNGAVLQPGEYKLALTDTKLTIIPESGKNRVEVTVKVETVEKKFDVTSLQLDRATGKSTIAEIRLGGTKTKLILQ
ncbi:MAG TPA: hypothetical protein VHW09_33345 [Bryobacteraceae bacterium]|jgi:hypothetical protein|nr:hypothetical protein [Bryobacteraceae bacterium]